MWGESFMDCTVFEGNRTFGFMVGINLAAWELNFRGFSHLKWKKFPGEDPGPPALVRVLPLKRGVGTPLLTTEDPEFGPYFTCTALQCPGLISLCCFSLCVTKDISSLACVCSLRDFQVPVWILQRVLGACCWCGGEKLLDRPTFFGAVKLRVVQGKHEIVVVL